MSATARRFIQCDVFSAVPTKGNGLAVVVDGDGLSDRTMQDFAAWTNLAETTFLMAPEESGADYKVRIFTPAHEMPFAGHPTLGSCAAWRHAGGRPRQPGVVVQECAVGLVEIDIAGPVPAFKAPPTRIENLPDEDRDAIATALSLSPERIVRSARLDNGPVWQVLELASAADVLAADSARLRYPDFNAIGLFGPHPDGADCDYEVRMLAPSSGMSEDPITGSLNAAIGCWMYGAGLWQGTRRIAQGTAIDREGRVTLRGEGEAVWVGGESQILIDGQVTL